VNDEIELHRIPSPLRPKLAREFLKSLQETYEEMLNSESSRMHSQINNELSNVFRYWFAQVVLEPSMKTELTVEDVETHFHSLFNTPLRNGPSLIHLIRKKDTVFCGISLSNHRYSKDIFTSLKALVRKLPKGKGAGAGFHWLNGYVAEDGAFVMSSYEFYSLDDLRTIIDRGTAIVDEYLVELGRDITPENRCAFLTFAHKDRKFKNTWKFYDWGVTDPAKILALKKSKVVRKQDVQMYNELPDEMFYELLSLEAGVELEEPVEGKMVIKGTEYYIK
jgi:hypothetical protein